MLPLAVRQTLMLCAIGLTLSAQTQGPLKVGEPRTTAQTKPAPPRESPPPPNPPQPPNPTHVMQQPCISDPENDKRPLLKRRKPGEDASTVQKNCEDIKILSASVPPGEIEIDETGKVVQPENIESLPFIDQVRIKVDEYTGTLPNFICEQLIRRYQSASGSRTNWKLKDTVTVEVMVVDGKEDYRNAKRNGRKTEWTATRSSGSWSEGEFYSMLNALFHPGSQAEFTLKNRDTIGGVETDVYSFVVQQPRSSWTLQFEAAKMKPKFKGSVWIDPKEKVVRRIEQEALDLPLSFPVYHAEQTIDYGPVRIDGKVYILPTKTENLACFRETVACSRNETEFRNYRKFSASSNISTTESNVTFEGEEKAPPPPPKKKP